MKSIKDIPDESIRRLAETLRSSGLAASETEAIRMAMGMARTSTKVTETASKSNESETPKEEEPKTTIVEEPKQEQAEERETPVKQETKESMEEDEFIEQEIITSRTESKTVEKEQPAPVVEENDDQPETTQEIPVNKSSEKKDLNKFEESKVDLGAVFKYKS